VKRAAQALAFVAQHGIVLASARGAAPRLIDAIAGELIAGNWWSHPQANTIYNVLAEVQASEDILVCRLLGGKITLVHRRLWPALVRAAETSAPQRIARVSEEHTASGRHAVHETPFPQWVPADVLEQAQVLSQEQALRALGLGAG
jgi:hypothetical protein